MVMLLKMTAEKVLWLLGLFTTTTFAYNSTCTDLSWERKVKRLETFTLRNAGNHILVLSSMRLDCFGDDEKFVYTNKSVLLNPGQSIDLPSDPWMSNCSATFCSACLIHQCNITTQLNPNATLTFLYNASNLVDFSGVGYTHQSHVRTKKYGHRVVAATAVCPSDMVSVWTKQKVPTVLIDIPNRKKKRTVYTVKLICNESYLLDDYGNATESFTHTTSLMKSRADVIVRVPLQELGETPRTCTLDACLHRRRRCKQKVLCMFTIPDNSVALKKISKWKKTRYKTVGCSQTNWLWSMTDQETGNLHIKLRNKDWKEKSFIVSVRCKKLKTLNNSLLVTIPPMVYTKLVTFPLTISAMKRLTTSTKCVIKLCNTAKRRCGRNTKCSIMLPLINGKFMATLFNITDNNMNGQCGSKAVTWSPQGTRQGTLSVDLQNSKNETVTATASVSCSGLDVLKGQWNLAVELPANSRQNIIEFKLKPSSLNHTAVETYCTVNICITKNCKDLGESCNITIPVKDGLFPEIEDENMLNMNNNNSIDNCDSKSVIWTPQGAQRGLVSVQLLNSRQVTVTTQVSVNCSELEVLKNEWNRTFEVSANSLHTADFKLKPQNSIDVTAVETHCTVKTCDEGDCVDQGRLCSFGIKIPIKDGSFPEIEDGNNTESNSVIWSKQGIRQGTLSVQLQNSEQNAVVAEISVNCSGLEVVNEEWVLTLKIPTNSLGVAEFELRPSSTIDIAAVETSCTVKICNTEDCENQEELHDIIIPIKDGLFGNTTGILTNELIWSKQGIRQGTLSVQLQNSEQNAVVAEVSVNCSGLEVVNEERVLTLKIPTNSLGVAEFELRPSSTIDIAAVETSCTVKICNTEDCENQEELHDIIIPIKDGLFGNTTGILTNELIWSQQGTQQGALLVQLQNTKQKAIYAEVTVNCSGLEVANEEWNLTVKVHANSVKAQEFKLRPSSTIDIAAVETSCTVKICNTEDCKNQEELHDIIIPIKDGLFGNTTGILTNELIWSKQGIRQGTLSVQLQNSEQNAVVAEISVNCSGLEVVNEEWTLTLKIPTNSLGVAEFELRPSSTIDIAAEETSCTVKICNTEDCENQEELHDIIIPIKDGLFGNTTGILTNELIWSQQGTQQGALLVQLQNTKQKAIYAEVTVNCSGLEVANEEWNLTVKVHANSVKAQEFKLRPSSTIDIAAVETSCTVKICNTEDCENQEELHDIIIPIKDGLFGNTTGILTNELIWSKQGIRQGTLSVQLQNSEQNAVVAEISVNCSGLEVVNEEGNLTLKIATNSLGVAEFELRPSSTIDIAAVETSCTVKICNTEDCENQEELHDIIIPIKDGLFANELIWSQQGTQRGALSVQLQNTKQKAIYAEVTVNCSGLEVANEEWNLTVKVHANSVKAQEFKLRPSSTIDYAAVETNCTVVISLTSATRVSHITIPIKNGLFPDGNTTDNNNTDGFYVDSVVWSQKKQQRGLVLVQLNNTKQETVIAQVSLNCTEVDIIKEQWKFTVEVNKNSQLVVKFRLKPGSTIHKKTVKTYCTVEICNTEDCENQGESHLITIPLKKGLFSDSEDGDTPFNDKNTHECDSNTITWLSQGTEKTIVSIQLQNSKQETVATLVSVICSELDTLKNDINITVDVPANEQYVAKIRLKPKISIDVTAVEANCIVKICNREDCENQGGFCSYDITIPIKDGLFPENDIAKDELFPKDIAKDELFPEDIAKDGLSPENEGEIDGLFDENRIGKREATALCPSDIVFSNQSSSSSDFLTVFVIVHNTKKQSLPFNIKITCNNIYVFQDDGTPSVSVTKRVPSIQPNAQKVVEFRFQNNSNRVKACTLDICLERKAKCAAYTLCGFVFIKDITLVVSDSPTMTPPVPTTDTSTMTPVPTTVTSTMTLMPTEIQHMDYRECTQTDAVWEVDQPLRGVMRVQAYNLEQEEIEVTITLQCSSFLQPLNDRVTDSITVPGKSSRSVKFRFIPKTDFMIDGEEPKESQCVIDVCPHHDCTVGVKETCIFRIPMKDGGFVIMKPAKKKDNETKYISHRCHDKHLKTEIHSPAPCHDKMWNLVYTSAQLEGEALLTITLNLKPNDQVDLRTNVSLKCEGIIIEDDAQKTLVLSKYESQRNISFAFATIRSLHLERHTCTFSVQHSLLIASTDNITDDDIEKMCLKGKKCSIAIDSRLGRIIPKCNLNQVKSLINYTNVDQKSAKIAISISPSVYVVFTYEAHCSKNNPFTYDPIHEKKTNAFVSESKETKVVTIEYAPDCNNDTIRKEYENYRKDDCSFLLYGYCQGGELLLEKLVNIEFDDDQMYCTPKLLFNRWLQIIQKHTGIHSKPLAAILTVFIIIVMLLIIIILPSIIVVYFCCCQHHRDDAKRRSVGIVISSCDEWEETNAMLNAMSEANSKFLIGRSDQQLPDKKFPITMDYDDSSYDDSFDSLSSDYDDVGTPIYQLDSGEVNQDDHVDQDDSAIYHDPEDHHHYHRHYHHIDHIDHGNSTKIYTAQLELDAAIKQFDVINESIPEEQYSKLSVTRTDFSSPLLGWGDEVEDIEELLQSTNY